jgi:hypothetical protein
MTSESAAQKYLISDSGERTRLRWRVEAGRSEPELGRSSEATVQRATLHPNGEVPE